MRNYRRYYPEHSMLQRSFDGGATWFDQSLRWQLGRTESEAHDNVAFDKSLLNPAFFRYVDDTYLGPYYWLLDNDYLYQLAFTQLGTLFAAPHWQAPPSPRKSWSNGH